MVETKRIVVGLSGASGAMLGLKLLEILRLMPGVETHLVLSRAFKTHLVCEHGLTVNGLAQLAHACYDESDFGAPIASGSFKTHGMVVAPCSMKTLAGLAAGYSDNLLLRAGDVHLKERRPLVLAVRETPFSLIHIRNMETLTLAGAIIMPPVITCYHNPKSLDDMTRQIAARILSKLDIDIPGMFSWGTDKT